MVGPTRGDIHCDNLGRILVRFRWAVASGSGEDDDGVCWVHWLERWGGDGYGTQTLPRVGSEVLVNFLEGGEPIADGQIRSNNNRPAFSLPRDATKVGIKTRTVPNGGESEISIDDNPNSEQVLIRASRRFQHSGRLQHDCRTGRHLQPHRGGGPPGDDERERDTEVCAGRHRRCRGELPRGGRK